MKILLIDPDKDMPVKKINAILKKSIGTVPIKEFTLNQFYVPAIKRIISFLDSTFPVFKIRINAIQRR